MNNSKAFIILLLTFCLSACSGKDNVDPYISMSNTSFSLSADGDEIFLKFSTSIKWSVAINYITTHNTDWLTLSANSGNAGNNTLVISVCNNPLYTERGAEIIISCGNIKRVVTVKQLAKAKKSYANFNNISLGASKEIFIIKLFGYENSVPKSNQEWCKVHKTTKNNSTYLEISVDTNQDETRYAQISINEESGKSLNLITVKQLSVADQENCQSEKNTKEFQTQNRSSLFLIFTATYCPYTPQMQKAFELASDIWEYNIELVNVHVRNSELYCEQNSELSDYYNIQATPTGILDGVYLIDNNDDASVTASNIINLLHNVVDKFPGGHQIVGNAGLYNNNIDVNIGLNNLPASSYCLQIWVLESNITAPQADIINGNQTNFIHNRILRGSITPATGEEFIIEKNNSTTTELSYSYQIPTTWNRENLSLLIALSKEGKRSEDGIYYYVDNCISVPIVDYNGTNQGSGGNENLIPGDDIEL